MGKEITANSVLARQRAVFNTTITSGKCNSCQLRDNCSFRDETTLTCGAIDIAVEEFLSWIKLSPHLQSQDTLFIKSLSTLHATLRLAEMFFNEHGSIKTDNNGNFIFSAMFKDYTRMQQTYMDGLSKLGLSPQGRHEMEKRFPTEEKRSELEDYVDAKEIKQKKGVRPKTKAGHNRVLPRPGSFESGAAGYPRSFTPSYLQTPSEQGTDRAVQVDDGVNETSSGSE